RAGLCRLIAGDPRTEISEAANGQEALRILRDSHPDVVILDLNLPGISGMEVLARFKAHNPQVRVVVVSMHDNPAYVARVLQAGARGYVSKNAPPEQILEAVKRVAAGATYIDHETAQELALWNVNAPTNDPLKRLSPRDIEIMRLLADGKSLVEIAESLGVS